MMVAVQGVHADIHVYYVRGEVQGTRWSKASESRCACLFPSSEVMNQENNSFKKKSAVLPLVSISGFSLEFIG